VAAALSILKDMSRRRYEEALARWVHLKMVRVHVESVLRYGLPVNYSAWLLAPLRGLAWVPALRHRPPAPIPQTEPRAGTLQTHAGCGESHVSGLLDIAVQINRRANGDDNGNAHAADDAVHGFLPDT
jgi:hypothetical protein